MKQTDPEIKAMLIVLNVLKTLEADAAFRVLDYAKNKFVNSKLAKAATEIKPAGQEIVGELHSQEVVSC